MVGCEKMIYLAMLKKVPMVKRFVQIDDAVIDSRDMRAILLPVRKSVDLCGSVQQYERDMEQFTSLQRSIFAVFKYIKEVNNGGHYQFYTNCSGMVWQDAITGFELLYVLEGKAIIEASVTRFKGSPGVTAEEREQELAIANADFDDLDNKFWELDRKLNLTERIADFVEANRRAFYFEGEVRI